MQKQIKLSSLYSQRKIKWSKKKVQISMIFFCWVENMFRILNKEMILEELKTDNS